MCDGADALAGVVLHSERFGGHASGDCVRLERLAQEPVRAHDRVLADVRSGQHGGVIGDAGAVSDRGRLHGDVADVQHVVVVRVDVGVVADRDAIADLEPPAVVEQHAAVDDHVVADLQVVAVSDLHAVEDLHVVAAAREHALGQHAAEQHAQVQVASKRTQVELDPQPVQRLQRLVAGAVDVLVVLGLERCVARVERQQQGSASGVLRVWLDAVDAA